MPNVRLFSLIQKVKIFLLPFAVVPLLFSQRIDIAITQFKLNNGLNVILHEDHTLPTVSVNVWYHVGSGSEKPGRTGFAHLFEHILFEGSKHVPEGMFDRWLEEAGANNNGSTTEDRTNYYEDLPSNALELALFLESDRMGYLLDVVTPEHVDGQRDVVKNERRQRVENQPYGRISIALPELLYPSDHPYSWSVIGSMDDLSAATEEDVKEFFRDFYGPNNASLVVAGDIETDEAKKLIEQWFSDVPRGREPPRDIIQTPSLKIEKRVFFQDRVQLPMIHMAWHTPALFADGDAELDMLASVLSDGKNSRLYRRLVYEMEAAQMVEAYQSSKKFSSTFNIFALAKPGYTLDDLDEVIFDEIDKVKQEGVTKRELERAMNKYEASFFRSLELLGGFSGKANQLNSYYYFTGKADYFNEDLDRYRSVSNTELSDVANRYLPWGRRVVVSIVPEGSPESAAMNSTEIHPK
ncbi:MAG: peptidase M16 [Candidatus Marinimicrobia bacterium]|nr:peptidase M16 [Candidatus Neomarinimicrobiota bacterium]|tara:strand:- start:2005 stop:3405 length:1401 start_codon:yes stop_codon:yes gene_type:complete